MRRRMLEEAEKVAAGRGAKGLVRDPAQNECVPLPTIDLERCATGRPMDEWLEGQAAVPDGRA